MKRLDWWLGVGAVTAALSLHALIPRYEFHPSPSSVLSVMPLKIDRWTGAIYIFREQKDSNRIEWIRFPHDELMPSTGYGSLLGMVALVLAPFALGAFALWLRDQLAARREHERKVREG